MHSATAMQGKCSGVLPRLQASFDGHPAARFRSKGFLCLTCTAGEAAIARMLRAGRELVKVLGF